MMHRRRTGLFATILVFMMVLGSVGSTWAATVARSAVVDDDVFLEGTYLSVGISGAGSFGTHEAAPVGFHPTPFYGGRIGLSVDQDGFNTGSGPTTGDFFLPGTPEERFVVGYKIQGVPSVFNNAETMGDEDVIKESVTDLSSVDVLRAQWVGSTGDGNKLRVTQVVQFRYDQRFFRNTITLQNTGTTPLESVRYMRNVDPDQDRDLHGTYYYTTDNEIVVQQTADGKALVRATGLASGVSIFYYSADARVRVSTFGFTNTDPYATAAYDQAGVYNYYTYISPKGSVIEDQAISICADLGTLEPGHQQTFVYYTSLDADFQDALDDIENEAEYVIRASAGAGGTIDPVGEIPVSGGASQSFTITATPPNMIASVVVDGKSVSLTGLNSMTYTFGKVMANHTIRAEFRFMDVMAPVIELPDGVPQSAVGSPYDLHLVVTDDTSIADVGIFENGQRVGGSYTGGDIRVRLTLPDGRHELIIVAVDGVGNRTERAIILVVDTRPPVLTVDPPSSVSTATLTLTGSAIDAVSGLASLTVNGELVVPFLDGSFSVKLALVKGVNTFVIEATDRAGNTTSQSFAVTYSASSPGAPSSIYVVLTIGSADMEVNGLTRRLDAAPFIKDGRTLLPIRALIEALGGSVQWNPSTKTATVALGSRTVALTIGSTTALVNGTPITLDVAPMIVKGRTFLPLRAIAENLGLDLAWEPVSRTVSLTYWP
ncbi:MAG: hypothetical protein C0398_05070 [Coprothermobacter sp.]|nr:hypothetical protein [Coprothermobacter sp.]